MKKTSIALMALLALVSCNKEQPLTVNNGVDMTITASVGAGTKTSYAYTSGTQTGTIETSWEATETITVVSIGDEGITAVDEFSSTGAAGRKKAEFTGTWNGNEGDKVICLYPDINSTAGKALFSGVTAGSSTIEINFPNQAPSADIATIENCDLMIGDVTISGSNASVNLEHKIAVLRLGISGAYYWDGEYGYYITKLGISASSTSGASLFATHGSIKATKTTYTGELEPDRFLGENRNTIAQQSKEGIYYYYLPVLADGTLYAGDQLTIFYGTKERYGSNGKWETYDNKNVTATLTAPLEFTPGHVYEINAEL